MGLAILENPSINHLQYPARPRKLQISETFCGVLQFNALLTLLGFTDIPPSEMM
jgi:hypothetical protein